MLGKHCSHLFYLQKTFIFRDLPTLHCGSAIGRQRDGPRAAFPQTHVGNQRPVNSSHGELMGLRCADVAGEHRHAL
jgi:hypothetical protein